MTIISKTNYNSRSLVDSGGAAASFSRAGTKPDFETDIHAASNVPVYESCLLGTYRIKEVVADAVGDDQLTRALTVDRHGVIWGTGGGGRTSGATYRESLKLFSLNPSGTGVWELRHTFSGTDTVYSVHASSGGHIFVGTNNGKVWRFATPSAAEVSVLADIAVVLTMTSTGGVMGSWSFADKGDGATIWVSEFGSKDGTASAGHLIYRSDEDGAVGTWTEIFNLYDAAGESPPIAYQWHLHKLIYHPGTDILFVAHGDDSPCYLYKSVGGTGGNWQQVPFTLPAGTNIYYLKCTGAIVLNSTQILWSEDTSAFGAWLHTIDPVGVADTIEHIVNNYPSPSATFWHIGSIGSYWVGGNRNPSATGGEQSAALWVGLMSDPKSSIAIDYAASGMSWEEIAGIGNDGKLYLSYSVDACDSYGTARYRVPTLTAIDGLGVDPQSTNKALDPWFENSASHGSGTYGAGFWISGGGGKYSGVAASDHYMTKNFTVNQAAGYTTINATDPIAISFWVRWNGTTVPAAAATASLRLYMLQYNSVPALVKTSTAKNIISNLAYAPMSWRRYTLLVDPTDVADPFDATAEKLVVNFSPSVTADGYYQIDGVSIKQSPAPVGTPAGSQYDYIRPTLAHIAAASAKDVIYTTVSGLPATFTALGAVVPRYHFDLGGTYCIWSAYDSGGTKYLQLVIHAGHLKLIDDTSDVAAPILATIVGLPSQVVSVFNSHPSPTWGGVDFPADTILWALTVTGGDATISLATQRSEVETVTGAFTLPESLIKIYDGCSQNAGEEIGGVVIWRGVKNVALPLDQIKAAWDANDFAEPAVTSSVVDVTAQKYQTPTFAVKLALIGSGYTFSRLHATYADVSAHEISGGEYPAGGIPSTATLTGGKLHIADTSPIDLLTAQVKHVVVLDTADNILACVTHDDVQDWDNSVLSLNLPSLSTSLGKFSMEA